MSVLYSNNDDNVKPLLVVFNTFSLAYIRSIDEDTCAYPTVLPVFVETVVVAQWLACSLSTR